MITQSVTRLYITI